MCIVIHCNSFEHNIFFISDARLTNFTVAVRKDERSPYEQCHHHNGTVGDGKTVTLSCEATGRFLRVQLFNKEEPLTMCELKAMGRKYHLVLSNWSSHIHQPTKYSIKSIKTRFLG